jgi:hypothetical protein
MKRTRVFVGAAMAVAVLLSVIGCASSSSTSTSSKPLPPTPASFKSDSQWSHVLSRLPASGQVTVATALTAFATAIGPVPGAVRAAGTSTPIESGSLAIDWVLANWNQLTPAQQNAINGDLAGVRTASAGDQKTVTLALAESGARELARESDSSAACQTSDSSTAGTYRSQILNIEKEITSKVGVGFPDPIVITLNTHNVTTTKDDTESLMYTYGCAGTSIDISGPSSVTECDVHIQPRIFGGNGKYAYSASDIHVTLIHELTHCLLIEHYGDALDEMPGWYIEGVPTWVQSVLGGGDAMTDGWWENYLATERTSLADRTYDGMGFFTHLAETGTDVWAEILPIADAFISAGKTTAVGWKAADPTAEFLDNWGSGFAQTRYPGTPWKTGGSNLPPYQPKLKKTVTVKDGSTITDTVRAFSSDLAPLDVDATVVEVGTPDGSNGRITVGSGEDSTLTKADDETFCTDKGGCKCPDGSSAAGTKFTPMDDGMEYLGATGGPVQTTVSVTGESLADFCTPPEACMVGTWRTLNETSGAKAGYGGQANVIWTISKSGLVSLDYNGSAPLVTPYGPAIITGTQSEQITLPDPSAKSGPWFARIVSNDIRMGGVPPQSAGLEDVGSWTCSGDAMTVNLSGDGGDAIFTMTRTSH